MDFFEEQERARRRTGWLIVLFSLAVCGTVTAVYAAARLAVQYAWNRELGRMSAQFWDGSLFWKVASITVGLIVAASLYKIRAITASADSLAFGLGGRLLDPNTRDPYERRLLNVVEEMAIASGVPVPAVHVLPGEPGINAFAVGLDVSRSAIAVTDGGLKLLSRDELQGVVAHEFSHLLNGDSRINLRLLGLVHGILVIGLLGSTLLRSLSRSSDGRRRKINLSGLGAVVFVGASLYLIGSIGVFFTRLIKAAVSRERELLADASGVQFTRNPAGLAGALKKIGGLDQGSRLLAARAEEASHFFFSEGMARFTALMSTHPPLAERIRFLDPHFQGELPGTRLEAVALEEEIPGVAAAALGTRGIPVQPRAVIASVGALGDQHVAYAQSLLARIPQRLRDSIREPWVARALVLALLLDSKPETRAAQLNALLALGDQQLVDQVSRASGALRTSPAEARLPILDLALPALRRLSSAQYGELRAAVDRLIRADSRIGLFEYTLQRVLLRHLAAHFEPRRPGPAADPQIQVGDALSVLLSILAHAGAADPAEAARAFAAARGELSGGRFRPTLLAREKLDLRALDRALGRLGETAPRLRGEILGACVVAVATDGEVTIAEGELLRAISDSLGCPMPPLLPGQHIGEVAPASDATERPVALG
jgi:Zn-dependent protease with chaperone function